MNNLTFNETIIINHAMQQYLERHPDATTENYNKYLHRVVNRILRERNK